LTWYDSKVWKMNPGIPFYIDPLKFEDNSDNLSKLFVKNSYLERIIQEINQIINSMEGSNKRIYIIGERGMGKSTLLNYLYKLYMKDNNLVLYCDILGGRVNENADYNFLYSIFNGFQKSIAYLPKELEKFKKRILTENNKFGKTVQLQSFLDQLINDISKKVKIIILIDEFDKKNPDLALEVLSNIQNFLNKKNVFYIFAGTPKWLDMLDVQDYSGLDGKRFRLKTWDLDTTEKVIKRRLAIKLIYEEIFRNDALNEIVKKGEGIPRYILMRVNEILIEAGKRKIEKIDLKFVKDFGFWSLNSIEKFKKFLINNKKERDIWHKLIQEKIIIRDTPAKESPLSILIAIYKYNFIIKDPDQNTREKLGINLLENDFKNAIKKLIELSIIEERNKKYSLLQLKHSFEYIKMDLNENSIYIPYIIQDILPKKDRETLNIGQIDKTAILKSFFYENSNWYDKNYILNFLESKGEDIILLKFNFEKYISPLILEKHIYYAKYDKKYKKIPDYLKNEKLDFSQLKYSNLIDYFTSVIYWIKKSNTQNLLKNLSNIVIFLINKLDRDDAKKTITEIPDNFEKIILNSLLDSYYKDLFITNIREIKKINDIAEKKIQIILQNLLMIALEIDEVIGKDKVNAHNNFVETEDQVLREVCDKIIKYRDNKIEMSDLKLFLDQIKIFVENEGQYQKLRKCMVLILKRIKDYYYTFDKMANSISNEILKVLPKENIKTYFGLFEKSKLKSQAFWTYFIKKYIQSKKMDVEFCEVREIIENLKSTPINNLIYIIFVDDVVGTGNSFIKSYKDEFELYIKDIPNYEKYVKIYLVAGIGSLESIEFISNSTNLNEDRIRYSRIIRNEDKAFNENYWHDKNDLVLFKDFLKNLDPEYWDGWKKSKKDKGLEYLIIMEWNVPNNTISCLWRNNENWKALFPRN